MRMAQRMQRVQSVKDAGYKMQDTEEMVQSIEYLESVVCRVQGVRCTGMRYTRCLCVRF